MIVSDFASIDYRHEFSAGQDRGMGQGRRTRMTTRPFASGTNSPFNTSTKPSAHFNCPLSAPAPSPDAPPRIAPIAPIPPRASPPEGGEVTIGEEDAESPDR